MKLKVPKNTFDKAIKSVSKAVPSKGIQPILNNILLENINGHLKLNATDLDFSIEAIIPSVNEVEGSITISARKLEEIVSRLEEDDVYITVDQDTQKANLTCKSSNFDLVGLPAEDFPKTDRPDVSSYISLSKTKFSKMIDLVSFAASKYDVNNILGGIYMAIRTDDDKCVFEIAATDGNRLSSYECALEKQDCPNLSKREIVAPLKNISDIQRILDSSVDENIKITFLNSQIIFFTQDRFIVSRLLEGSYPRYKQLIPANQDKQALINRKDLLSCLERVATMANEITNLVKLSFKDSVLTIESSNRDFGQAVDNLDIEYSGEPIDIYFNVKYLIEPFKYLDCEKVQFLMSGPVTPALVKPVSDEAYLHLVMPIKHESNSHG